MKIFQQYYSVKSSRHVQVKGKLAAIEYPSNLVFTGKCKVFKILKLNQLEVDVNRFAVKTKQMKKKKKNVNT